MQWLEIREATSHDQANHPGGPAQCPANHNRAARVGGTVGGVKNAGGD
jgi:hypothetical protein